MIELCKLRLCAPNICKSCHETGSVKQRRAEHMARYALQVSQGDAAMLSLGNGCFSLFR